MKKFILFLLLIICVACSNDNTTPVMIGAPKWQLVYHTDRQFTYHKGDSVKTIVMTSDSTANVYRYKRE